MSKLRKTFKLLKYNSLLIFVLGSSIPIMTYAKDICQNHVVEATLSENSILPTCLTEGSYDLVTYCKDCNQIVSKEHKIIAPLGHDYELQTVLPSDCSETGINHYVCKNCGKTKDVTVNAENHIPGSDYVIDEAATCVTAGSQSLHCTSCNAIISGTEKPINENLTGHQYQYKDQINAGCVEFGERIYECSICHQLTKEFLSPVGHNYDISHIDATCTTNGGTLYRCLLCNDEYLIDKIPALGHTPLPETEEERIESTCDKEGSYKKVIRCASCSNVISSETVVISKASHVAAIPVKENEVKGSCTKNHTYDMVTYCSVCKKELNRTSVKEEATGHKYKEEVKKEATCTETGTMLYTCENCGYKYQTTIKKKDHELEDSIIEPTTKQRGYTIHKCKNCNYSFSDTYVDKLKNTKSSSTKNKTLTKTAKSKKTIQTNPTVTKKEVLTNKTILSNGKPKDTVSSNTLEKENLPKKILVTNSRIDTDTSENIISDNSAENATPELISIDLEDEPEVKDNKLNIGTILLLSLVGISVCGMIGGIIYTLYKKNK